MNLRTPRLTASAVAVLTTLTGLTVLGGCTSDPIPPTVDRPLVQADEVHSISLGFEVLLYT
jgi:hypothetical protein